MPPRSLTLGLLAAAALLAPLATARAADLDENYGYAEAPQEVPVVQSKVEFGTGWYVRGDLGAAFLPSIDAVVDAGGYTPLLASSGRREARISGAIGGGYSFNHGIRADLTAEYLQPSKSSNYSDAACSTSNTNVCTAAYLHSYDVLANVYYDIGTWSIVTPYVGAGAGVGFGHLRAISSFPTINSLPAVDYGRNYYNFAFGLMAGLSFDVFPHTKLDIGYRYLNLGTVQNVRLDAHEARAGLRYMIDN